MVIRPASYNWYWDKTEISSYHLSENNVTQSDASLSRNIWPESKFIDDFIRL